MVIAGDCRGSFHEAKIERVFREAQERADAQAGTKKDWRQEFVICDAAPSWLNDLLGH